MTSFFGLHFLRRHSRKKFYRKWFLEFRPKLLFIFTISLQEKNGEESFPEKSFKGTKYLRLKLNKNEI